MHFKSTRSSLDFMKLVQPAQRTSSAWIVPAGYVSILSARKLRVPRPPENNTPAIHQQRPEKFQIHKLPHITRGSSCTEAARPGSSKVEGTNVCCV